jgi:hypothetical protein
MLLTHLLIFTYAEIGLGTFAGEGHPTRSGTSHQNCKASEQPNHRLMTKLYIAKRLEQHKQRLLGVLLSSHDSRINWA